eukprot:scaffold7178_cov80-Skeletonema_dohrnii-CCMP3373.AAC.2
MVTKIITRTRRISSVKRSSAAEDSNRGEDEDNNKRNNTQGDNSNNDDKYHRNEGEENHLAKKLKGCQNKATDGRMICDNGHSYHDVFFRCKPNDDTTADDGKAVAFRQHTADAPLKLPTKNNKKGASSKYQGVYFDYSRNKWMAKSMIDGKPDHIGQKFVDLSDVPPRLPIIGNKKGASSKHQGVCFDKRRNKWKATIALDGKQYSIGNYDSKEEAAVDYARALFKYGSRTKRHKFTFKEMSAQDREEVTHKRKATRDDEGKAADILGNNADASKERPIVLGGADDSEKKKPRQKKEKFIDLSDVPPQLPIGNKQGASSKYQGVCFDKRRNKWKATISLDGKTHSIAEHANEEEAAVDYARALFKYGSRRKRKFIDLTDYETSKYQGVYFKAAGNKWYASISLDGKLYGIGTYDTEEEAAVDFARAKFKYVQNSSTMVEIHTDKESNGET